MISRIQRLTAPSRSKDYRVYTPIFLLLIIILICVFPLTIFVEALRNSPIQGYFQQVKRYGSDAGGTGFYIYVPDKLLPSPAIVVAIHPCSGSASEYLKQVDFRPLAEKHNFIAIYPQSPPSGDKCWDVSSNSTLSRIGRGQSRAIVNMVRWTIHQYHVNPQKIFVQGFSSGAMMTVSSSGISVSFIS
jgi:acetylxylan esterase